MAQEVLGTLGQAAPGAGATSALFTVPASHAYVVNEIFVCNTGSASTKIRIFARDEGAAAAVGNAIVYDMDIAGNDTIILKPGGVYDAADVLSVYSLAGGVTFSAFGSDVS